jgi:hypothetical protein
VELLAGSASVDDPITGDAMHPITNRLICRPGRYSRSRHLTILRSIRIYRSPPRRRSQCSRRHRGRPTGTAQEECAGERLRQVRKAREVFLIVELLVIADVEAARVAHRLKVPGRIAAFAQRRVNEVTPMLACKHRLVQLG